MRMSIVFARCRQPPRPDGEIGRRSGLKIRRPQGRGGSSPPPGTNLTRLFITTSLDYHLPGLSGGRIFDNRARSVLVRCSARMSHNSRARADIMLPGSSALRHVTCVDRRDLDPLDRSNARRIGLRFRLCLSDAGPCRAHASAQDAVRRNAGAHRETCPSARARRQTRPGPWPCFGQRHLHTAMSVDLAFAGSLDRQEDHVFEFVDHARLDSIGLCRGHATERLQRQDHVTEMVHGVVDVLAHFHVALAVTSQLMVEGMRKPGKALAYGITEQAVAEALGGIPEYKMRCSNLARRPFGTRSTSGDGAPPETQCSANSLLQNRPGYPPSGFDPRTFQGL